MMTQPNLALKIPDEVTQTWAPPKEINIADWVEANVRLTEKSSPEPGPLRIERTPYTRGPLEALGSTFIEWIVLVFGRQTGKTEGILIPYLCYIISQDPGPTVYFLPIQEKCKEVEAQKIEPILSACEAVQDHKTGNPDDYATLRKAFKTMVLSIAWGGSLSQTTTRSTRYLLRDETDEQKKSIGNEGVDPMKGIEQTTSNFPNRKIVDCSTPTSEEGNIWQELKHCEWVFEFWIPCPHCGAKQILYWENVRYGESEDPTVVEEMAYYECEGCHKKISNMDKIRMLGKGEWRARTSAEPCDEILKGIRAKIEDTVSLEKVLANKRVKKIGFHLPKWYSPFAGGTIGVIAKEYLEAKKKFEDGEDFALLRNWKMYNAAIPWQQSAVSENEVELMANKIALPKYICPQGTIALTAGIDPGQRGFWYVVLAWKPDYSSHLVEYGWSPGDYDVAYATNEMRMRRYEVSNEERDLAIWRLGIDTGGGKYSDSDTTMTERAYRWIRSLKSTRVFGTKGQSWETIKRIKETRLDRMPGTGNEIIPGGLLLIQINTNAMKDVVKFHWEEIEEGKPGRFTLNADTEMDFIRHRLAENLELQKDGSWEWVRKRPANHLFDALVIAFAMADSEFRGGIRVLRMQGTGGEKPPGKMPPMNPVTQRPRGEWIKRW